MGDSVARFVGERTEPCHRGSMSAGNAPFAISYTTRQKATLNME